MYQVNPVPHCGKFRSFRMTLCATHQNGPVIEMNYPNRSADGLQFLRKACRIRLCFRRRGRIRRTADAAASKKPGARRVRQFAAIAIAQQMCLISLAGLLK
ncbi:hypothetical protein DIE16_11730 [Burkholderia sp. Bp9090]|nr:hypothetical protein DIE16_11730 [Burkholderia sp. Bp9090]